MALVSNVRDRLRIMKKKDSRRYTKDRFYPSRFAPSEEAMEAYPP